MVNVLFPLGILVFRNHKVYIDPEAIQVGKKLQKMSVTTGGRGQNRSGGSGSGHRTT